MKNDCQHRYASLLCISQFHVTCDRIWSDQDDFYSGSDPDKMLHG